MKKIWLIILSVSLSVLFAAGEAEHLYEDTVPDGGTAASPSISILYDAFAERHMVAREFLNDAVQASSNALCSARQYNSYKVSDLKTLSRITPHRYPTGHYRSRIAFSIGSGIASGYLSDYVTAILRRIII